MKIVFNKVTWYSKLFAVILFVGVFAAGFWVGAEYHEVKILQNTHVLER